MISVNKINNELRLPSLYPVRQGKLSYSLSVLHGCQAGGDVRLLPPDCQAPKVDGKIATANTNGNRPSKNNGGKQRHYDSQYQGMEDDSRGFHVSIPFDGGSRFTTKIRFNRFIQKIRSVSVPPSAWFPSKVRLQRSVAPKLPGADSRWRACDSATRHGCDSGADKSQARCPTAKTSWYFPFARWTSMEPPSSLYMEETSADYYSSPFCDDRDAAMITNAVQSHLRSIGLCSRWEIDVVCVGLVNIMPFTWWFCAYFSISGDVILSCRRRFNDQPGWLRFLVPWKMKASIE